MAIIKFKTEEEWKKFRKGKIGGTIISAICNQNPYKSNLDAYNIITNATEEGDSIKNTDAIIKGKKAEELILKLWALDHPEYKVKHYKYVVYTDDKRPHLYCSPDGVAIDKDGNQWMIEIKTAFLASAAQKENWKDNAIPPNYYCQTLDEYHCNPKSKGTILIAELMLNDLFTRRITRFIPREGTEEDLKWMLNEIDIFYNNHIVPRIPPSLKITIDL